MRALFPQYCSIFRQIYAWHCITFYCVASFSIVDCIVDLLLGGYYTIQYNAKHKFLEVLDDPLFPRRV